MANEITVSNVPEIALQLCKLAARKQKVRFSDFPIFSFCYPHLSLQLPLKFPKFPTSPPPQLPCRAP